MVDIGDKFSTGGGDTSGAPSLVNISLQSFEKFEMPLMLFSGAWGKMIHGKKLRALGLRLKR